MLSKSNPAWDVRFLDDTVDLMVPSESRYATLHISIPTDANPGFYGYNLYAASVFGNFSVNSTMVIEVKSDIAYQIRVYYNFHNYVLGFSSVKGYR